MNEKGSVSAIITTYKREPVVLIKAISSVLNQTYSVCEIIVVDDNPNDSVFSSQIIEALKPYKQIIYIKQDGNKGACAARNLGIRNSKGDYIAFLDDDDEWLPGKIEAQIALFDEENVGLVSCCGFVKDSESGKQEDYYNMDYFKDTISFNDLLVFDCVGSTSQPLIKRACFDMVGDFWEEQPARQDYEMWLRIATKYSIKATKEKLFVHYYHFGEQVSKNTERAYRGLFNIFKRYYKAYFRNKLALNSMATRLYHTLNWDTPFRKFAMGVFKALTMLHKG